MNNLVVSEGTPETMPAEYGGSLAIGLARAEVDQQITTARSYPRSIAKSVERIMTLATLDATAAAECIYALPRGRDDSGQKKIIKGPSIRLAEIIASQWGNCRVGARVVHVDRFEKYVEAEGVFHDLETNMATTARIRRGIVDSKGRLYRDDMIVTTGNAACAIAKRNAILGGVPRGVWRKAYDAVEHVISGDVKTLVSRRRSALATLAAEYKITEDRVFAALEIGGEEDIDLERLSTLTAMRSSLKNGEAEVEELFPKPQPKGAEPKGLNEKLDAIAAGANGKKETAADPATGKILTKEENDFAKGALASQKAEAKARKAAVEKATSDALDLGTQRLLDDARAMTKEGALKFKYWAARLNKELFERLSPYYEELRAEAKAVDDAKVSG